MNLIEATNYFLGEGDLDRGQTDDKFFNMLTDLDYLVNFPFDLFPKDDNNKQPLIDMTTTLKGHATLQKLITNHQYRNAASNRRQILDFVEQMVNYIIPRIELYMEKGSTSSDLLEKLNSIKKQNHKLQDELDAMEKRHWEYKNRTTDYRSIINGSNRSD